MKAARNTNIRIKLLILIAFLCVAAFAFTRDAMLAKKSETAIRPAVEIREAVPPAVEKPVSLPDTPLEGCVKCHNNIEPMHRYNATGDVFDKLVDGRDAQGLSCTGCHGGNPAADTQKEAHVQPRFPKAWSCKNGECSSRNPERTNTLIAKESREFVRFVNPGDFRVVSQSCGECQIGRASCRERV